METPNAGKDYEQKIVIVFPAPNSEYSDYRGTQKYNSLSEDKKKIIDSIIECDSQKTAYNIAYDLAAPNEVHSKPVIQNYMKEEVTQSIKHNGWSVLFNWFFGGSNTVKIEQENKSTHILHTDQYTADVKHYMMQLIERGNNARAMQEDLYNKKYPALVHFAKTKNIGIKEKIEKDLIYKDLEHTAELQKEDAKEEYRAEAKEGSEGLSKWNRRYAAAAIGSAATGLISCAVLNSPHPSPEAKIISLGAAAGGLYGLWWSGNYFTHRKYYEKRKIGAEHNYEMLRGLNSLD